MENTFNITARIIRYNVGGMLTLGLWFPDGEFFESSLNMQATAALTTFYDLVPADAQPFETAVVMDIKAKEKEVENAD